MSRRLTDSMWKAFGTIGRRNVILFTPEVEAGPDPASPAGSDTGTASPILSSNSFGSSSSAPRRISEVRGSARDVQPVKSDTPAGTDGTTLLEAILPHLQIMCCALFQLIHPTQGAAPATAHLRAWLTDDGTSVWTPDLPMPELLEKARDAAKRAVRLCCAYGVSNSVGDMLAEEKLKSASGAFKKAFDAWLFFASSRTLSRMRPGAARKKNEETEARLALALIDILGAVLFTLKIDAGATASAGHGLFTSSVALDEAERLAETGSVSRRGTSGPVEVLPGSMKLKRGNSSGSLTPLQPSSARAPAEDARSERNSATSDPRLAVSTSSFEEIQRELRENAPIMLACTLHLVESANTVLSVRATDVALQQRVCESTGQLWTVVTDLSPGNGDDDDTADGVVDLLEEDIPRSASTKPSIIQRYRVAVVLITSVFDALEASFTYAASAPVLSLREERLARAGASSASLPGSAAAASQSSTEPGEDGWHGGVVDAEEDPIAVVSSSGSSTTKATGQDWGSPAVTRAEPPKAIDAQDLSVSPDEHRGSMRRQSSLSSAPPPAPNPGNNTMSIEEIQAADDVPFWSEPPVSNPKWVLYYKHGEIPGSDAKPLFAATLNKQIERLTSPKIKDLHFMRVFMTTYSAYCTPEKLFTKLKERFTVPPPPQALYIAPQEWLENTVLPVQLAVIELLQMWISEQLSDLPRKLMTDFVGFLEENCHPSHTEPVGKVRQSLANRASVKVEQRRAMRLAPQLSVHALHANLMPHDYKPRIFDAFEAEEIANHLSLIEFHIYSEIRVQEFVGMPWSKASQKHRSPNVLAMITRFNRVGDWVASVILSEETPKERGKLFCKFIRVAECLRRHNNFNTMLAVTSGLSSSPVHRLRHTRAEVPAALYKSFRKLVQLMNPALSYKSYREALAAAHRPCVPYLGVYLTDLTFLEQGNPDYYANLINIHKHDLTYSVIMQALQFQDMPYGFHINDFLYSNLNELAALDETEMYRISLAREPREPQPASGTGSFREAGRRLQQVAASAINFDP